MIRAKPQASLFFAVVLLFTGSIAALELSPLDTASWMAKVRSDTPVSAMVLPGTHDSCARRTQNPLVLAARPWVITQKWTIAEQLAHGIRYFDMRVGVCEGTNNRLCMFHGDVYLAMNFDNALSAMTTFLRAHPSEGLVMRLQVEKGDVPKLQEFVENNYIARYPGFWFSPGATDPKDVVLGDLRGKILVFWSMGDKCKLTSRFGYCYSAVDSRDNYIFALPIQLLDGIRDRAIASSRADITGWYENPTSGVVGGNPIAVTAGIVVPFANAILQRNPMAKGIVSMDFPSDELIHTLIKTTLSRHLVLPLNIRTPNLRRG